MTNRIYGVGKLVEGQIRFVTVSGDGFVSSIGGKESMSTRGVEPHEVPRDIRKAAMKGEVQPLIQMLEKVERLDVPSFMKNKNKPWKQQPQQEAKVYKFKRKGGDIEEKSIPEKMVDELIDAGKDVVNPFLNYFFGRRL